VLLLRRCFGSTGRAAFLEGRLSLGNDLCAPKQAVFEDNNSSRALRGRPRSASYPPPFTHPLPPSTHSPQIPWRGYSVDFMAAGLSVFLTILVAFTTFGGATFNLVITLAQRECGGGGAAGTRSMFDSPACRVRDPSSPSSIMLR
jgi:hypothetical protein